MRRSRCSVEQITAVLKWAKLVMPVAGRRGHSPEGEVVVYTLNRLVAHHGEPKHVFVDNGSESTGRILDRCAYHHGFMTLTDAQQVPQAWRKN